MERWCVPKAYWVTHTVMFSRTKDRGSLVKVRHIIEPGIRCGLGNTVRKQNYLKKKKTKRLYESRLIRS